MANKNQVFGQGRIKFDGETLDTKPGASLELGGPVRTAQEGDFSAGAFSEATAPSKLTATLMIKPGTRVTDLREIDNATVTFQADTGQTYLVRNAYVADVITVTSGGEGASVVFQGPPAEEM